MRSLEYWNVHLRVISLGNQLKEIVISNNVTAMYRLKILRQELTTYFAKLIGFLLLRRRLLLLHPMA
jgi:hypothetical protein